MESTDKSIAICCACLCACIVLIVVTIWMPDSIRAWNGTPCECGEKR